jgi:hypothetical protein
MCARKCPVFILHVISLSIAASSSAPPYSGSCTCQLAHYRQVRRTHMVDRPLRDRYSNTLLVSLNNRISIRDGSRAQGGVIRRSRVGSFPSNTAPSEGTAEIMLMDMEKSSTPTKLKAAHAFAMESEAQESVISAFSLPSPLPFLSCSSSLGGCRHCMIRHDPRIQNDF